jgi:hypothetical protein
MGNTNITALEVVGNVLFAGTHGGGVCCSTDRGATWISSNSGLGSNFIQCVAADRATVYAGTSGVGVYRSTNFGHLWECVSAGLSNLNIFSLAVAEGSAYAGTFGDENARCVRACSLRAK